jgi:cell division protease FtsH
MTHFVSSPLNICKTSYTNTMRLPFRYKFQNTLSRKLQTRMKYTTLTSPHEVYDPPSHSRNIVYQNTNTQTYTNKLKICNQQSHAPPLADIATTNTLFIQSVDELKEFIYKDTDQVSYAQIIPKKHKVELLMKNDETYTFGFKKADDLDKVVSILAEKGILTKYKEEQTFFNKAFLDYMVLNFIIPTLFLFFLFRLMAALMNRNGKGGMFSFTQSQAKFQEIPDTGVSFDDVAGCETAKRELQEIVEFLKNPSKFTKLGAKIPKGCLLIGPSGTGKTLLAKAVAGEANVPFFSCSASDWIEIFVGVGSSRVRSLFKDAAAKAPCIVFVDEIDAVGKARSGGGFPSNDERDQTINQLLTEMDGFDANKGVIVLAATNRPDILDSALTRPGRFDRKIIVERPDCAGRVAILKVHTKNKPLAKDVDLERLARVTAGSSGADLENLANEAAILASRKDKTQVEMQDFEGALDKITLGEQRVTSVMSDAQKKTISVHEAGHALVSLLVGDYDRLKKVTIIPRGSAGGVTVFEPNEERVDFALYSRQYLKNQICVALGGRIAEQIAFGDDKVTTGASSDLTQVMNIARRMVTDFGFSSKLGNVAWKAGSAFSEDGKGYSEQTAFVIDNEIKRIVSEAYSRTENLLKENEGKLMILANALIENETMSGEEVMKLLEITEIPSPIPQ